MGVDRFFDDHAPGGVTRPTGQLAENRGARVFAIGSYVGEVLRRGLGGTWRADPSDPGSEVRVQLVLPDGSVVWPVARAVKRCRNGPEDGIAVYGSALGLDVGPPPGPPYTVPPD